jgi:hypothetical protein
MITLKKPRTLMSPLLEFLLSPLIVFLLSLCGEQHPACCCLPGRAKTISTCDLLLIYLLYGLIQNKTTLLSLLYLFLSSVESQCSSRKTPIAKFIVPDWRLWLTPAWGIVSYLAASLCSLAGQYDNRMQESTLSPPVRDYEYGHSILFKLRLSLL